MMGFSNDQVAMVFRLYPERVRGRMLMLRELVFDTAGRLGLADEMVETLKWGEPSYLCAKGTTVRMGWSENVPDVCGLFFHCQTSLVSTFRAVYPMLDFDGNRAVRLPLDAEWDTDALGHCVELALTYHSVKHLPLLGAER